MSTNSQMSGDELSGALEVVAETLHSVAGSGLFDARVFSTSDAQRTMQLLFQVRYRGDPQLTQELSHHPGENKIAPNKNRPRPSMLPAPELTRRHTAAIQVRSAPIPHGTYTR